MATSTGGALAVWLTLGPAAAHIDATILVVMAVILWSMRGKKAERTEV